MSIQESLILRFSLHKKRYRHLLTWDQAPQRRGEKGGRQKRKISERSELGLGVGGGGDEKLAPLKTPAWEAKRLNSQRTSNQKT